MIIAELSFYCFAAILIFSAISVVMARNPVHSVLFLILAFVTTSAIFLLIGAEFVAMMLVIVYVGAVAVLFLFVVMMIGVEQIAINYSKYKASIIVVTIALMTELAVLSFRFATHVNEPWSKATNIDNTRMIGQQLYTKFAYQFELSALALLVAMIGAIVLTLEKPRKLLKKQNIHTQLSRDPKNTIKLVSTKIGEGIMDQE